MRWHLNYFNFRSPRKNEKWFCSFSVSSVMRSISTLKKGSMQKSTWLNCLIEKIKRQEHLHFNFFHKLRSCLLSRRWLVEHSDFNLFSFLSQPLVEFNFKSMEDKHEHWICLLELGKKRVVYFGLSVRHKPRDQMHPNEYLKFFMQDTNACQGHCYSQVFSCSFVRFASS